MILIFDWSVRRSGIGTGTSVPKPMLKPTKYLGLGVLTSRDPLMRTGSCGQRHTPVCSPNETLKLEVAYIEDVRRDLTSARSRLKVIFIV